MFPYISVFDVIMFLNCLIFKANLTPLFYIYISWKKDTLWHTASLLLKKSSKRQRIKLKNIKSLSSKIKRRAYFCLLYGLVGKFKLADTCYSIYLPPGRDSMSACVLNLFLNSLINASYLFI